MQNAFEINEDKSQLALYKTTETMNTSRGSDLFKPMFFLCYDVLNHHGYRIYPGYHHAQRHHVFDHKQKTRSEQKTHYINTHTDWIKGRTFNYICEKSKGSKNTLFFMYRRCLHLKVLNEYCYVDIRNPLLTHLWCNMGRGTSEHSYQAPPHHGPQMC